MNKPAISADLDVLQTEIYREKVMRARQMTPRERLAEAIELTDCAFERMLDGAMWQLGTDDPEKGWAEVRRRMERLCKARDHGFYTTEPPPSDHPPSS